MGMRHAWETLVVAGTNALRAAGLPLAYGDAMADEKGHVARFAIDGVPCVAASRPIGFGEENIAIVYDTQDVGVAVENARCAGALEGGTAAKCILERERGPYIMKVSRLTRWTLRSTASSRAALAKVDIQPDGYTLNGPFIL